MGIFSKQTKDDRQARENEVFRKLGTYRDENSVALFNKLNNMRHGTEEPIMKPFSLYMDCMEIMMCNPASFPSVSYYEYISYAESIYKDVFIYDEDTPDFDTLQMVFIEMFDRDCVAKRKCFHPAFFHLFRDKHNYVRWVKGIDKSGNLRAISSSYVPYATEARSYFVDEDMFTAHMIGVTNKFLRAASPEDVYEEEIRNIRHMAGIYDVDEALIHSTEQKLLTADKLLEKATAILQTANERLETIEKTSKSAMNSVKNMCGSEVEVARAELSEIDVRLKQAYNDFIDSQKKVVLYDKQQLLNSVFADAEQKLNELKQMAQMVVSSANLELMRINQESGDAVSKLETFINNDAQIKKLMSDANANQQLLDKIDKLMIINDQNIEQISKNMAKAVGKTGIGQTRKERPDAEGIPAEGADAKTFMGQTDYLSDDFTEDGEEELFADVSPLLDENIDFRERFERVMAEKENMLAKGEHFHKMFDDVVIAVMENANPYLIGPSGCGKTYMVSQIARILGLDFIDIGYINEEYDILGFQTANGGYSRPNFYRCYKYGKIAFCDELDNGNSRATVKLNSFLSNVENASYNFPNGENVKRHANFRMIGAGNTAGNGADSNYNTREKIEESVQQRFLPIYIDYDNDVEKKILGEYKDWYEFVVLFRKATDEWGKSNFGDAPGIITTRDVTRIKKYLDHESFSAEQIMDYEFIQTKDSGYLAFLENYMRERIGYAEFAQNLIKMFSKKVDAVRERFAR